MLGFSSGRVVPNNTKNRSNNDSDDSLYDEDKDTLIMVAAAIGDAPLDHAASRKLFNYISNKSSDPDDDRGDYGMPTGLARSGGGGDVEIGNNW